MGSSYQRDPRIRHRQVGDDRPADHLHAGCGSTHDVRRHFFAFAQADKSWKMWQARVKEYVDMNGGEAGVVVPVQKVVLWSDLTGVWCE